jgi:chromosome segregation ATPase
MEVYGMSWLKWFGRWGERDQAESRLGALKREYGGHGERVIRLSARTDLARKSAGSTLRAFDFVERAFVTATEEYARIGELIGGLEAGLQRRVVGDFAAVAKAMQGLGPSLDELERHLTAWEANWQQVPQELDEAERLLAELRLQVEAAVAAVGAPLPLTDRLAGMAEHLARTRRTLADGNPVEAGHLVADFRIALERLSEQTQTYASGAGAITQAERDTAEVRERLAAVPEQPPEAVSALSAVDGLLQELRPNLAAGKLEQFQADLLQIQKQLSAARAAIKH